MREYVQNIYDAVSSTLKGMAITWRNFVRTPVTIEYPDADIKGSSASQWARDYFSEVLGRLEKDYTQFLSPMAARYRGFLTVDIPSCISCRICETACPISCIVIDDVKTEKRVVKAMDGEDTTKLRDPVRFDIDIGKCMFCGLCVEPCPTGSIFFTKEFELPVPEINGLLFKFVSDRQVRETRERAAKAAAAKPAPKPPAPVAPPAPATTAPPATSTPSPTHAS
ncbi:MAG: 4Fe-4S dicluster domain-containing protein [Nitrospirae bacterium]|nr:4Fe-4S dicluster domain-containing protein [Nitrospirota bacterium]